MYILYYVYIYIYVTATLSAAQVTLIRSALLVVAKTKLRSLERHPLAPGQLRVISGVVLSRAADFEVCVWGGGGGERDL